MTNHAPSDLPPGYDSFWSYLRREEPGTIEFMGNPASVIQDYEHLAMKFPSEAEHIEVPAELSLFAVYGVDSTFLFPTSTIAAVIQATA